MDCALLYAAPFQTEQYAENNVLLCLLILKQNRKKCHLYLYQFLFFCAMLHMCDLAEVTHENMNMVDRINAIYH